MKPQLTTLACSVAAFTAAANGLRGLPAAAYETVITQPVLRELTGSAEWAALSAEGGGGVHFDQLQNFAALAVEKNWAWRGTASPRSTPKLPMRRR
ncbi:hypothetical protein [Thalassovita taeanensis]|uniref:hypothetical protein n=1 Tax=Thalassovita taeanensis TaxID=657014 RepID=UPI001114E38E|nr:hypothetical protein [Thalassovita taeanensis]